MFLCFSYVLQEGEMFGEKCSCVLFSYVLQEGEMFGEKYSCVLVMCSKRERCLERSILVF